MRTWTIGTTIIVGSRAYTVVSAYPGDYELRDPHGRLYRSAGPGRGLTPVRDGRTDTRSALLSVLGAA